MTRREVALAALIAIGAVAFPVRGVSAPRTRSIHLEITLPNGAITRVIVPDGEGASVRVSDGTAYGFVPTIRESEKGSTVVVAIWVVDEVPNRQLGEVDVAPGGGAVTSDTSPRFSVRVVRVLKAK
jgi:hypothetical protein